MTRISLIFFLRFSPELSHDAHEIQNFKILIIGSEINLKSPINNGDAFVIRLMHTFLSKTEMFFEQLEVRQTVCRSESLLKIINVWSLCKNS